MIEVLYFVIGVVLTALLIPWVQKASLLMGYVDTADGDALKIHAVPTPHSGGIAIFSVFVLILFFLSFGSDVIGFETCPPSLSLRRGGRAVGLLLGGSVAFGLGLWDDLKQSSPSIRLSIQAVAGMAVVLFGQRIEAPLLVSLPLTLLYVVGAINAVNMEDGVDGLAGGMGLISLLGFGFLCAKMSQPAELIISSVLGGVVLSFLFYNLNPSSIFMGNSGSYFVGFVLAYLAVSLTSLNHWPTFIAPILIIGVPVFDTAYAILRRLKNSVSPFTGDRNHFYDKLMQMGLSVRQTVLVCWGVQTFMVVSGVIIYLR